MNKEEVKLALLKVAREEPSLIGHLALEKNVGDAERIAVYAKDNVYQYSTLDLLIRITTRFAPDKTPEFDIHFHDGLTPPLDWNQTILGEFGMWNEVRQVFREQIEFDGSAIHFILTTTPIYAQDFDVVLSQSTEVLYDFYYYLNTGISNVKHLDFLREIGRGKSKNLQDYYIDCVFSENEYQKLLSGLNEWGIQNNFSESEMRQIKVFCDFCKQVKGTKQESKMIRIIEYLQSSPLPHRVA